MARTKSTARKTTYNFGYKEYIESNLLKTVCEDKELTTTTIDELKQCLKITFGIIIRVSKKAKENRLAERRFEIIEKDTDGKIEIKLKEINLLSSYKEKEQQLVRILLEHLVDILLDYKLYYEYLVFTNGDFIEPVYNTNDINEDHTIYQSSIRYYTSNYFSYKGLEILLKMDSILQHRETNIQKVNSTIPKDEFLKYIELLFSQDRIIYSSQRLKELLSFVISGNVIDDGHINYKSDQDDLSLMISCFDKIKELINNRTNKQKDIFKINFDEVLPNSFKLEYQRKFSTYRVIDNNTPKMSSARYKWLINYILPNITPSSYELYNSLEYLCIDSTELIDFIIENKEFYQINPHFLLNNNNLFKMDNLNFKSFQIASYFENQLNELLKNSSVSGSISKESVYSELFMGSIKECDVETLNSIQSLLKTADNNKGHGFSKIPIKISNSKPLINLISRSEDIVKNELENDIKKSAIYSNELLRNKLIDHLNNTSFNCFSIGAFKMFKSLLPPPPTPSITQHELDVEEQQTYHIGNLNFISNPILSTELLLDSIFELDFKMVKSILDNDNFQLSKSTMCEFIKNSEEYKYELDGETITSKFNFKDIKDLINYLLLKLPTPSDEDEDKEYKSYWYYIYKHLYKCLIQSQGINSLSDLIGVHQTYEQYQIESVYQDKELFNVVFWVIIKSKKLAKLVVSRLSFSSFKRRLFYELSSFRFGGDHFNEDHRNRFDIDKLSFDFILNCNNFKDLFLILIEPNPNAYSRKETDEENESYEEEEEYIESIEKQFQYLLEVGEVDLFIELFSKSYVETNKLSFRYRIDPIVNGHKVQEFLNLSKVGYDIDWFIEKAIHDESVEIFEYFLINYKEETLKAIASEPIFKSFFDYPIFEFMEYLFKNHLELVIEFLTKQEEEKKLKLQKQLQQQQKHPIANQLSKRIKTCEVYMNVIIFGSVEVCDLFLKYVPQHFKFDQDFINDILIYDYFQLIHHYFEIGVIKSTDLSLDYINSLKTHKDYQYLKWVKNL